MFVPVEFLFFRCLHHCNITIALISHASLEQLSVEQMCERSLVDFFSLFSIFEEHMHHSHSCHRDTDQRAESEAASVSIKPLKKCCLIV